MYSPGQLAGPMSPVSQGSPSVSPPYADFPDQAASPSDFADQTPTGSGSPYVQDWSILLDDGRRIVVEGLVLLGRNPQPRAGEEDAQLIKIADETRTVSKSHLAVGVDAGGVYVVDRGSTNGSTVSTTNGMSSRCRAGEMVRVGDGAIVSIGDHWLEITRGN
jgi:FHA domain